MDNYITVETIRFDKISQDKRMLYYLYYYLKMKNDSFGEVWEKYIKRLEQVKDWKIYYEAFFLNESIDNEKDVEKAFSYIIDDDKKSMCDELKKVWKKVKNVICKEEKCEKKLYKMLREQAQKHPIISKFIICILSSILFGLVEDCIYDAAKMSLEQQKTQDKIYVSEENDNYIKVQHKNGKIVIEGIYVDEEK